MLINNSDELLQSVMKVQCLVFAWISVIYLFLLFPASQHSVETRGTVVSGGWAASVPEKRLSGE